MSGFPPLKKQMRKKQQEKSYLVHFLVVGRHADECPAQAQSAKRGGDEEEEWSSSPQ